MSSPFPEACGASRSTRCSFTQSLKRRRREPPSRLDRSRTVLRALGVVPFFSTKLMLANAGKVFDEQGRVQDPAVRAQVERYILDFVQFVVRVTAILVLTFGFAEAARAQPVPQTDRRALAALRMNDEERIELDGRLDEGPWQRAVPAAGFIQQDPDNGKPATEATEVRIIYNSESLYMLSAGSRGSA